MAAIEPTATSPDEMEIDSQSLPTSPTMPHYSLASEGGRETVQDDDLLHELVPGRTVRLVIYRENLSEELHSIWLGRGAKYRHVTEELTETYAMEDLVVLQAQWGPEPFWVEANPDSYIEASCRVLYALHKVETVLFVIAVVRDSRLDWPIPIYQARDETHVVPSRALDHLVQVTEKNASITDYINGEDVGNSQVEYTELEIRHSATFPTAFVITKGMPPEELMSDLPYKPIPAFLQIHFLSCDRLIKRAYDLKFFTLQMIYLSSAIRHLIISLGNDMRSVYETEKPDIEAALASGGVTAEILRVAPQLSRELVAILGALDETTKRIESGIFDRNQIQDAIANAFIAACSDFPGAVTIRRSYKHFKKLECLDDEDYVEASAQALGEDNGGGLVPEIMRPPTAPIHLPDHPTASLEARELTRHSAQSTMLPPQNYNYQQQLWPYVQQPGHQNMQQEHLNFQDNKPLIQQSLTQLHPVAGPSGLARSSSTKLKLQGQRSEIDPQKFENAFKHGSHRNDPALRYLLDLILSSRFYKEDQPEPILGSADAEHILVHVRKSYPIDGRFARKNEDEYGSRTADDNEAREAQSIFMLFTENNQCLICGAQKDRTGRALGHVRSDIGHRPYHCTCEKCLQSPNPRKFFSDNLLDDHIKGQTYKQQCDICQNWFRRGGMKRHLRSMHPGHPASSE